MDILRKKERGHRRQEGASVNPGGARKAPPEGCFRGIVKKKRGIDIHFEDAKQSTKSWGTDRHDNFIEKRIRRKKALE